MRSLLRLGTLLILSSIAAPLAQDADQAGASRPATAPIVDYTWYRIGDREQLREVRGRLVEIRNHLARTKPEAIFSLCTNYGLEPEQGVHAFVQVAGLPEIDEFWVGDAELDRMTGELEQLVGSESVTKVLRQIAGEVSFGPAFTSKPYALWTARPRFGRIATAQAVARELTDHVNASYPELTVRAFHEFFGDWGTIWWLFEVEDAPAWERNEARLLADERFLEILERAAEAFLEDSFEDTWAGPI